jgi:hypothetical protein
VTDDDGKSPLEMTSEEGVSTMKDRAFLVYVHGKDRANELVPFTATLFHETEATPQLHVLQAKIEKRLAPGIVQWGDLVAEFRGDVTTCVNQDASAFICDHGEQYVGDWMAGV